MLLTSLIVASSSSFAPTNSLLQAPRLIDSKPQTSDIAWPRVIFDSEKQGVDRTKVDPPLPDVGLGVKILLAWEGAPAPFDELGTAVSCIEDIDGDGRPDCVLGSGTWGGCGAHPHSGYFCVASSSSGRVLYRVDGVGRVLEGDAFGRVIRTIGDRDGDHVSELALGAWKYNGYTGFVGIFSGKTGALLGTLVGKDTKGEEITTDCEEGYCGFGFGGYIASLGSAPQTLLVSNDRTTFACTLPESKTRPSITGVVLGSIADEDGDGVDDFVICHGRPALEHDGPTPSGVVTIVSGAALKPIREARLTPEGVALACMPVLTRSGKHSAIHSAWIKTVEEKSRESKKVVVSTFSIDEWKTQGATECDLPEKSDLRHLWSVGNVDGEAGDEVALVFVTVEQTTVIVMSLKHGPVGVITSTSWGIGSSCCSIGDTTGDGVPELLLGDMNARNKDSVLCGRAFLLSFTSR